MEVEVGDYGMQSGNVIFESVGALGFGPDDILFVADSQRATVVALDVADQGPNASAESLNVEGLDSMLASYLGCSLEDVHIADLAIHPRTHNVYLSVMRGAGDAAVPAIIRVSELSGALEAVPFEGVRFSEIALDDAPTREDERIDAVVTQGSDGEEVTYGELKFRLARSPIRAAAITDIAYVDGTVFVAGLSNEEFSSTLRRIPFPFAQHVGTSSLEIFHVSHGLWETAAPIRTFAPYAGGSSIIASYTCTPLVTFSVLDLNPGAHVKGRTVAELGSVNTPLDIVAFSQDGEEYLLVSNSNRPLMKLACRDIDGQEPLTEPKTPEGAPRQEPSYSGIGRMASLNDDTIIAIQLDEAGGRNLRSLSTASL